jgi:type I restriction enzyme R subunit
MITDIRTEDRLVERTFAGRLRRVLRWATLYAFNDETFGPADTLDQASECDVVLVRDLRAVLIRRNPGLPGVSLDQAIEQLTLVDCASYLVQHNGEFCDSIRDGVRVSWRHAAGQARYALALVLGLQDRTRPEGTQNKRLLAVRELIIQGLCAPHYNRRADLVGFVDGLPR